MVVWFWPFTFADQVVAPQLAYRGETRPTSDAFWHQVTAKPPVYGDFPNQEVGEVLLSITSPSSGPIATWTDMSGHGRALFPHFAYTQSNFTTWMATIVGRDLLDGDVYTIITIRNLTIIYIAGLFLMLHGMQIGVNHWASMLAGFVYATSPLFSAWIVNYPFLISGSMGMVALYAIHRLTTRPHPWVWLLLAWAIHIEITSAYIQHIIYLMYILVGYIIYIGFRSNTTWSQRIYSMRYVISAIGVGIIASVPMLVDLYSEYQFSIRDFGKNATVNSLPYNDLYRLTALIIPEIHGVKPFFTLPIERDLQLLHGRYFTWLMTLLIVIGIIRSWRNVWGWVIWLGFAFATTYIQPIHDISFMTLFPQISAWSKPFDFASLHLPAAIIMMWGLHQLVINSWRYLWVIAGIGVIILAITVWSGHLIESQPRWAFVIFELGVLSSIWVRSWWQSTRYTYVIAIVVMLSSALVTFPTIYRQAHADMYVPSPPHQIIKENLDPGHTLIEISAPKTTPCCFVRGNENIMFDIPTSHVYRSNISTYYNNLIRRLGGRIVAGSVSNYLQARYNHPDFWMLNAGIIISYQPQQHPTLEYIATHNNLNIYRNTAQSAGCCLLIPASTIDVVPTQNMHGHQELNIGNIRKTPYKRMTKSADYGDTYQIDTLDGAAAILVINHPFHPKWYAYQYSSRIPLQTVVINQVYQGIIIPDGVTHITMEFTPWSRWMWIVHWIWLASALVILIIMYRRHKKRGDA